MTCVIAGKSELFTGVIASAQICQNLSLSTTLARLYLSSNLSSQLATPLHLWTLPDVPPLHCLIDHHGASYRERAEGD
jgi:hypothetical protein